VNGRVLLSVGHLIERKGHDLVIDALTSLPDWTLLIVGEGPLRGKLQNRAIIGGLGNRVRLVGAVPQDELIDYYNAADILVLASTREGMANVLLEAAACGTPVIATRAEGSAEVISEPEMGRLLRERSSEAMAAAVHEFDFSPCSRERIREQALALGWGPTTTGLTKLYRRVLQRNGEIR
jgi:glycosyltransferase involved in cell wall biosynthesis